MSGLHPRMQENVEYILGTIYLHRLITDDAFECVPLAKRKQAEKNALAHRYFLKKRAFEHSCFKGWHEAQQKSSPFIWEGERFEHHPTYWYVKALIKEQELKAVGFDLTMLDRELYEPRHEWLYHREEISIKACLSFEDLEWR